jgi:hypothetical protein
MSGGKGKDFCLLLEENFLELLLSGILLTWGNIERLSNKMI